MKLLVKYSRINSLATILVLLVGGFCYYFVVRYILINQLDKDLKIEEQEVIDYVQLNNRLPLTANYKDQKILFEPLSTAVGNAHLKDSAIFSTVNDEGVSSRKLTFLIPVARQNYKVSVIKSQEETEDLIQIIVMITLAVVALLLIVLFIINRFLLNKLWHPFYHTLHELKRFNVNDKTPVHTSSSNVDEFKELDDAVLEMSGRVLKDYNALKSFTENASHEMQTPLAVVKTKLELLMQSDNLSESQMQQLYAVQDEAGRLSKLNQSLLLLTKIDNHQFQDTSPVNMGNILTRLLNNYGELITAKQIQLTSAIDEGCLLVMNDALANVLVSNLMTNAIKHNINGGSIKILLNEKELIISNSGLPLITPPEELFERFKKDKVNSDSLGLGLPIVRKIADQYSFSVSYTFRQPLHIITLRFV